MTMKTEHMRKPSDRPTASMNMASGSFETPPTMFEAILVMAVRPCCEKWLVTKGFQALLASCWSELMK